jgi:hypothetical protein
VTAKRERKRGRRNTTPLPMKTETDRQIDRERERGTAIPASDPVRQREEELSVEAARPPQRGINRIHTIRGTNHNNLACTEANGNKNGPTRLVRSRTEIVRAVGTDKNEE